MVLYWVCGDKEIVCVVNLFKMGFLDLDVLSLGNFIGIGFKGVIVLVVEVKSLDELEKLGREKVEGKIVFFN